MGTLSVNFSLIRVFTTVDSRKAHPDEVHSFTSEAELAQLKGAGEIDEKSILKFPTADKMASTPGKKEGEITVFREGRIRADCRHGS